MRAVVILAPIVLLAAGCGWVQIRLKPGVSGKDDGGAPDSQEGQRTPSGGDGEQSPPPAEETRAPGRHGDEFVLDRRWHPLTKIVERGRLPFISATAATTVSPKIYVADLDDWLESHPVNTPLFDALLYHEQLHAIRQERYPGGVDEWVDRYLVDLEFMLAEEQLGWYEQIKHLRGRGLRISPEGVAKNLSKYRNLRGSMISYDDALKWVNDVLANRWRPPQ